MLTTRLSQVPQMSQGKMSLFQNKNYPWNPQPINGRETMPHTYPNFLISINFLHPLIPRTSSISSLTHPTQFSSNSKSTENVLDRSPACLLDMLQYCAASYVYFLPQIDSRLPALEKAALYLPRASCYPLIVSKMNCMQQALCTWD